ncbi:23S rRNA (guanosine(2251)-2'-O)-methyltransferase RlmB [Microaceticoccus formicicus]|uniref:23S rRNA (guanosine(2251)-2'-O)-methyltransferase RlmB n=1 Tax=Microaceticoccus formicicus TaxID=3118105 RepID=UPI003CCFFAD5|nr:23S rRNA (guanosine(2251)-2'-O)-methyltransferase RlmB [Peptoniphilaceae bacterium AMB_02]
MKQYVCGRNAVMELLKSGVEVDKLYIQKGELKGSIKAIIAKASDKRIIISEVDKRKLDELSEGLPHQGVVAYVSDYKYYEVDEIIEYARSKNEAIRLIILDEIEDPHNTGSIIRTAETAGFHGVIMPKRRSSGITTTVHKASAGATTYMKVAKVTNIAETINRLKEENIWVYGADGDADTLYTQADLKGNVCLVIGNEGKGITRLVKERCDQLIKLPMFGRIESLNASNAAAILIYEVVRQNA